MLGCLRPYVWQCSCTDLMTAHIAVQKTLYAHLTQVKRIIETSAQTPQAFWFKARRGAVGPSPLDRGLPIFPPDVRVRMGGPDLQPCWPQFTGGEYSSGLVNGITKHPTHSGASGRGAGAVPPGSSPPPGVHTSECVEWPYYVLMVYSP